MILVGCTSPEVTAKPKDRNNYAKRILGRWLGSRKFVIFHANGNYGVQRNENAPEDINGRWRISGDELVFIFSTDNGVGTPSHITTASYTITSFTAKSFTTEVDGHKEVYDRAP